MNGHPVRRPAPLFAPAPQAVFFDLDGTLVDTASDLTCALNRALREAGQPSVEASQARLWVGGGAALLVDRGLHHALNGAEPGESLRQSVLDSFLNAYEQDICRHSRCYRGVVESLEALSRSGLRLACVTNKRERFTGKLLRELDLCKYFDVVVSGDTTAAFKPDPKPLLHAAAALSLAPADCLMVGDSDNDIGAARAASMPLLWFPHGYHHGPAPTPPQIGGVLSSFEDLPGLLGVTP